ncbi:endonuclease/exonuclease/phosphatase family metal-dependent hydrolase [Jatrophihabitans sp. GAS493]|uniref:endonuclease/exonuclease/phosphatase family protein n=1 Tax=Jatrophihabitans sp. GAS493 TaxID=1907575 RepID=UPI000BB8E7EC|nr:endonuclease/exonuclease/phosphatase family protein [Jatrophihabitans sp. GAS493]SOD74373.1 endonuclease/exonuclease/phosphatase family metal-dependent hydrolase [Jatrophihabitans sp. GAS493]
MTTLRLLSYNVRSLRDDGSKVARIIRDADPHVVCLQEAPRFLRWRSRCAELARHSSLVVVGGGRSAGANLILSSLAVDVVATADFALSRDPRLHRRGMVLAQLRLRGVDFAVAGVHLDVVAAPRLRHVEELKARIAATVPAQTPTIIAGDVNDDPGSPAWLALSDQRVDAWGLTHAGEASADIDEVPGATSGPRDHPRRRIDAVFVPPALRVASAAVLRSPDVEAASDHRPVLVEIELND